MNAEPELAVTEAEAEKRSGLLRNIYLTTIETIDKYLIKWGQRGSLWPMPMGISCCAIEMMGLVAPRYDISRFGMEVMRFSPRQADCMIVAGTVTYKMAPVVRRIYDQMATPKWVIAMGACVCSGGLYRSNYSVVPGIDHFLPVDVYVGGCPPRPESVIDALLKLREWIKNGRPEEHPIKIPG